MIQRYNFLSGFTILILSALLGATIICHFERSPKGVVEKSQRSVEITGKRAVEMTGKRAQKGPLEIAGRGRQ